MATGNGYFVHSQDVMELAYSLVKGYDEHEREQDKIWRTDSRRIKSKVKKFSKQGGMIKDANS